MSFTDEKTRKITISAICIALATVLSMIKIFQMPLGGSVTLCSMLPIAMISIKYGIKWGTVIAFAYSVVQFLLSIGNISAYAISPVVFVGALVFDYIIAYTVIGLSGIFIKKSSVFEMCAGITLAVFLRFVSHCISGILFFKELLPEGWNPVLYSIVYNGAFLLPEMIITIVGAVVLFKIPAINKILG